MRKITERNRGGGGKENEGTKVTQRDWWKERGEEGREGREAETKEVGERGGKGESRDKGRLEGRKVSGKEERNEQ